MLLDILSTSLPQFAGLRTGCCANSGEILSKAAVWSAKGPKFVFIALTNKQSHHSEAIIRKPFTVHSTG
jgi:hypothetical protein